MRTTALFLLIPLFTHSQVIFERDNVDKTLIRAYENGKVINTYQQDKTDKTVTWVYDAQDRQIGTLQQDKTDKDVTYWYPVSKDEPLPELPVWDWWNVPDEPTVDEPMELDEEEQPEETEDEEPPE